MNKVIKSLKAHRSYRSYEDKPVDEKQLDEIIKAVQASPSWINGQQYSILPFSAKHIIKEFLTC